MIIKRIIIIVLLTFVGIAVQAQTVVKGHVVNERGGGVGYVSIGIEKTVWALSLMHRGYLR